VIRNAWKTWITSSSWLLGWAALAGLALAPALLSAADPRGWKLEAVYLKTGKIYRGLVEKETADTIHFCEVWRRAGKPTRLFYSQFKRSAIERIERLPAREHAILNARVHALDPTGKGEKLRMEHLTLEGIPWGKDGSQKGLCYRSLHFVLRSNAREDIVRWAAIRLEQVYAAYVNLLPPRRPLNRPTTIFLLPSVSEYLALAKSQGVKIYNPAYFDSKRNQVVCGLDLQKLGEATELVRRQEDDLKRQEGEVKKRYKGKVPGIIRAQLKRDKAEIERVKKENEKLFRTASQRLFQTLFHEAFHAYLDNFVYPTREAAVPCWLNEGLAQIFETAIVEADELRVERVDGARLARLKASINRGDLVPLDKIIRAQAKEFHVVRASDHQIADGAYLTSWGLAHYLWVDRKVLSDPDRLEEYITSLKRGVEPAAAFRTLAGKPLPVLQKDFLDYYVRLQPDGSLVKKPDK
jgi:hypothetical protein